ncbi:hypothetical protein L3073_05940 [Ancylomarina sp. DW003]|nr:hypothetical protein [Ancylomarina sp. DW003]MDE5421741.1 hypothetical protein [Ancylomarina sp. DW003]
MGVLKNRRLGKARLKEILKDPSKVLIIHYSCAQYPDEDNDDAISPLITAIVIRALDDQINEHFSIHYEADKAGIIVENISDNLRELELQVLKSFNRFIKRHSDYIWVHWEMKNIHFGFPAIKHRFDKLFNGTKEQLHEIPSHKNFNFYSILEFMYGEDFADLPDSLSAMIKVNSRSGVLPIEYIDVEREGGEFERQNYSSILSSLDCKVSKIRGLLQKFNSNKKIIVNRRNNLSVLVDIVNHPFFLLVGWIASIIGVVLAIMTFV